MKGALFEYNSEGSIAFSNEVDSTLKIVYVNGLGGTLMCPEYIHELYNYCFANKIHLIIPQLRSMPNYKVTAIESDIEDLKNVLDTINGHVVLLGFSTGCNDILLLLKKYQFTNIEAVVLQSPVSDTESMCQNYLKEKLDAIAMSSTESKFIEFSPHDIWLKERFISLYSCYGKEDLFSSYLNDQTFLEWKDKVKILSVLSGNDQFVKKDLRSKFELMGKVKVIKNGDHCLSEINDQREFINILDEFLNEVTNFKK